MLAQVLSLTPLNLQLREVNRAFAESIDDVLWQQMKAAKKKDFDAQWDKQQAEIDYLKQSKDSVLGLTKNNPKVIGAYQKLEQITNQTTIVLYAREKTLNFINEAIVRQKINAQSNSLDCAKCHLTRFPEALMEDPGLTAFWKNLTKLDLRDNRLSSLPGGLGQLTALQWLYLSDNKLSSLPESLGRLTALQWLDLDDNELSSLPEGLSQLTALQYVYLQHNQLSSLPEGLGQLTALQSLSLEGNQLSSLPEGLNQLTALRRLSLSHNRLSLLPEGLGQLTALRRLSLSHNHLDALPDTLSENILVNQQGYSITKEQVLQAQTERLADSENKPTALGRP
jgi:Leucine-rich repeat (LRR) protein